MYNKISSLYSKKKNGGIAKAEQRKSKTFQPNR